MYEGLAPPTPPSVVCLDEDRAGFPGSNEVDRSLASVRRPLELAPRDRLGGPLRPHGRQARRLCAVAVRHRAHPLPTQALSPGSENVLQAGTPTIGETYG